MLPAASLAKAVIVLGRSADSTASHSTQFGRTPCAPSPLTVTAWTGALSQVGPRTTHRPAEFFATEVMTVAGAKSSTGSSGAGKSLVEAFTSGTSGSLTRGLMMNGPKVAGRTTTPL